MIQHLGDISKISGYDAPVVDCVIGGSPCQDLSVAGKRAGLAGERSGLFMEQIRIIKEMRERDRQSGRTGKFVRPRYGIWENVPGALSSPGKGHNGEDFAAVLEEFVRVAEPEAPAVSVPAKGWPTAGCLYDVDGRWSIAWRVLDAQFWGTTLTSNGRVLRLGTPQRRRRIALVADFGGLTAPEILFVREGLSGYPEEGKAAGEGAAGGSADRTGGADPCLLKIRGGIDGGGKGPLIQVDKSATLSTLQDQTLFQPCVAQASGFAYKQGAKAGSIAFEQEVNQGLTEEKVGTLNCMHDQQAVLTNHRGLRWIVRRLTPLEWERLQGYPDGWTELAQIESMSEEDYEFWKDVLLEREIREGRVRENEDGVLEIWRTVEVEDENVDVTVTWENTHRPYKHKTPEQMVKWYNKMVTSDGHRYQSLGNSIALPQWKWIIKRLCGHYERDATMGSLFDGIGGFPYIWEQVNGKGSCLWASEIEPFQIAVTRERFR